uniref:Uncharacterized protein n=1 Tax=Oryza glumipatula TaxID=40148 RepID=A0A0D9ZJG0_9ORYZ
MSSSPSLSPLSCRRTSFSLLWSPSPPFPSSSDDVKRKHVDIELSGGGTSHLELPAEWIKEGLSGEHGSRLSEVPTVAQAYAAAELRPPPCLQSGGSGGGLLVLTRNEVPEVKASSVDELPGGGTERGAAAAVELLGGGLNPLVVYCVVSVLHFSFVATIVDLRVHYFLRHSGLVGGNILHIMEENGGDNWFTWRAAVVVGWKQVAGTCSGIDGEVGVLGDVI